jgi:hypothetical protein
VCSVVVGGRSCCEQMHWWTCMGIWGEEEEADCPGDDEEEGGKREGFVVG